MPIREDLLTRVRERIVGYAQSRVGGTDGEDRVQDINRFDHPRAEGMEPER